MPIPWQSSALLQGLQRAPRAQETTKAVNSLFTQLQRPNRAMGITDNIPGSIIFHGEMTHCCRIARQRRLYRPQLVYRTRRHGVENPNPQLHERNRSRRLRKPSRTSMANAMRRSPEECQSEQPAWVPITTSNCEAELEEVYGHELEHQIRRQLLIPRLGARPSEQAILLSNCEGELQEVSGHEHEQQKRRLRNADSLCTAK